MSRSSTAVALVALLTASLVLAGCGGGHATTTTARARIAAEIRREGGFFL